MSEHVNPYTSEKKKKSIMDLYEEGNYPKGKDKPKKVNLVTSQELEEAKLATISYYDANLKKRNTDNVSHVEIKIPSKCDQIELFPLSGLNILDISNPGKSIRNNKYLDYLTEKLTKKNGTEKVVMLCGDLFGWQWKLSELAKADITEDNKVLWFGINLRLQELQKIITKLLKTDAHIILMRGAQENKIMKDLNGLDVISELIKNVKKSTKYKGNKLYYVDEGVQEIIQFVRPTKYNKNIYYPIELRTNNTLSRASKVGSYLDASIKNNGEVLSDIPSFDFNGNVSGIIGPNHYSVSNIKEYKETPTGKKPALASKTHNEVNLFLNEDGTIDVAFGGSEIIDKPDIKELKLAEKLEANRNLFNEAQRKIKENEMMIYNRIVKEKIR